MTYTNVYAEACNAIVDDPASTTAIQTQAVFIQRGVADLAETLEAIIALRDRPHGFPDNDWYEAAFNNARAALAKARPES